MNKILIALIAAVVIALPLKAEASTFVFNDVLDGTQNGILEKMKSENIISGYRDGTFKPAQTISRAQMAVIIDRAFELTPIREAVDFKDVPTSHVNYEAIQALYRAGIIDGSNGKFNPSKSLTRAHVAKIITKVLELEPVKTTKFKDVSINNENNGYIGALVNKEITVGFEDGTFKPEKSVTRMQFATFLYRSLYGKEKIIKTNKITSNQAYAPSKLSMARYTNRFSDHTQAEDIYFDNKNHSIFAGWDAVHKYWASAVYYNTGASYITMGFEGTDHVFFTLDLRGLVENHVRVTDGMYGREYTKVSFNHTLELPLMTFKDVVKVERWSSNNSKSWYYYLKEGFGVLYVEHDETAMFELNKYTLRK